MAYYKKQMFFCCNQKASGRKCCQDAHARAMCDYAKHRIKKLGLWGKGGIRINVAGCLGRCDEGPTTVIYPDGIWYTFQCQEDIDAIIDQHLVKGKIVERLLMPER